MQLQCMEEWLVPSVRRLSEPEKRRQDCSDAQWPMAVIGHSLAVFLGMCLSSTCPGMLTVCNLTFLSLTFQLLTCRWYSTKAANSAHAQIVHGLSEITVQLEYCPQKLSYPTLEFTRDGLKCCRRETAWCGILQCRGD